MPRLHHRLGAVSSILWAILSLACVGPGVPAPADALTEPVMAPGPLSKVATTVAAPSASVDPPNSGKPGAPPVQLRGQFIPGGAVRGVAPPDATVTVAGQAVRVGPNGEFIFGFGREEAGPVTIAVEWPGGRWVEEIELTEREFDIQRVNGVAEKHVNPPAEVSARIKRENAQVGAARRADEPRLDWAQPFIWPLTGPITGVYGSQRVYNGEPRSPHFGLDIAAPTGAVVVAPAAAVVTLAQPDLYFSGGTLILDHGHGIFSTFIHLSEVLVAAGERVQQGQQVARVGATGRATGPHLDWRINWFQTRLDPALWMQGIAMPTQSEDN